MEKRTAKLAVNVGYDLGYTQERYADELGIDPRTIRRWVKGETGPDGETILKIIELCEEKGIDYHRYLF